MPLTQWDKEIQTLSPGCAHEAFAYGICLRRQDLLGPDGVSAEDSTISRIFRA
jgi:hypothetical protein